MQFVPLPLMKPLNPSSLHIFPSAFGTLILYSSRPTDWIWNKILSRSRGDTTVLETAPATPPAINDAKIGFAKAERTSRMVEVGVVVDGSDGFEGSEGVDGGVSEAS